MNVNNFEFTLAERTFMAMQGLVEGLLTHGDAEYMERKVDECVTIMAEHGWSTPTQYTLTQT